jgi:hypothetical protein
MEKNRNDRRTWGKLYCLPLIQFNSIQLNSTQFNSIQFNPI